MTETATDANAKESMVVIEAESSLPFDEALVALDPSVKRASASSCEQAVAIERKPVSSGARNV